MLDFLPENISSFGGEIDGVISYIWRIILAWLVATEAVLVYLWSAIAGVGGSARHGFRRIRGEPTRGCWFPPCL